MIVNEIEVYRYITKSKIKGIDFVINPYIGCPNGCLYCYAKFLNNFNGHKEKWGEYLDVKKTDYKIKKVSIENKTYLMSSICDPYNLYEEKYQVTRKILEKLINFNFNLIIETKNKLILRDIDLLKQINNLKVIISLNTLDDNLRSKLEKYSSIEDRLYTIKKLHKRKINVVLKISPFLPSLTDYRKIIKKTKKYVSEYQFDFLRLNNISKREFLKFIKENYGDLYLEYAKIYLFNKNKYFKNLKKEIEKYAVKNKIKCYFTSIN